MPGQSLEQELQHLSAEGLSEKSEALLAEHGLHQPSAAVLVQQDFSNWLFFLSCQVMCR